MTGGAHGLPAVHTGYTPEMSISTITARPPRRTRAQQLLALLRAFDDALAGLDDEDDDIVHSPDRAA